jgi:hypothetical protein
MTDVIPMGGPEGGALERVRSAWIEQDVGMALRDLSGIGAITDALGTTNTNLAAVLRELQETNGQRLAEIGDALRELNAKVDRLVALEEARAATD